MWLTRSNGRSEMLAHFMRVWMHGPEKLGLVASAVRSPSLQTISTASRPPGMGRAATMPEPRLGSSLRS